MIWYVATGSALGGVLRFLMVPWAQRYFASGFPGGTLVVNVVGSLAIGLILRLAGEQGMISPEARVFLTVGVCGGFTTFSAFSLDFAQLVERGALATAAAYLLGSVALAILGFFIGAGVTRLILS